MGLLTKKGVDNIPAGGEGGRQQHQATTHLPRATPGDDRLKVARDGDEEAYYTTHHQHPHYDRQTLHHHQDHLNNHHPTTSDHHTSSTSHHNRRTGVRWVLTVGQLSVCCLWVLLATPANTCADSNGCDFYGSGLEQDGRGVQPVYLSCSSGRVEWQYPRAGLRVILKSPHKGREFHACIKGDKNFEGARIYLEGHRSLLPIFALDDGRPQDLIRCFTSNKGQAALYVEAEPGADDLKKQVASFEYDLQSLPKGVTYDPIEECRPCTEEELLHLYCSGDFVARGSILKVRDYPRLAHTTITVRASKIFQQTSPVFRHGHAHTRKSLGVTKRKEEEPLEEDDEEEDMAQSNLVQEEGYLGRVEVPLHCGAQAGLGEFMVMGVMRLGHAVLRCAPRQEEWRVLALKAQSRAQCVLET